MQKSVIKVRDLHKKYDYYKKEVGIKNSFKNLFYREKLVKHAVKGISFDIQEGEMVGFLGANGAGKTTTLKMLSGILYPTSGEVSINGYTPWKREKKYKQQFAIVMGQKNQLWWDLPANESFELNRHLYEIDKKDYQEMLGYLTELLDVKELLKVQVRRLSLGERMKMELIASLLHKPRILFLDEPTIGLDLIAQRTIRDFIMNYNKENKTTVLFTSHYMQDIESLCKRVIIINDGSIVYDGELKKVNELFESKKIIKLQLEHAVDSNLLLQLGSIKENNGANVVIEVAKKNLKDISKQMLDQLPVIDFNIEEIPIEEGVSMLYKGNTQTSSKGGNE